MSLHLKEPQPRDGHAAFCIGKKQFVWGGDVDYKSTKVQASCIETFDISSAKIKWEKEQQHLQGSLPDSLWGMAVTTDDENAYSFGGSTGGSLVNTIYVLNPSTLQCSKLLPESPKHMPKGRTGSRVLHFDEKLVVHGGDTGQGRTDDVHVFDLKKSECRSSKKLRFSLNTWRCIENIWNV